jgi:hypothetical protein
VGCDVCGFTDVEVAASPFRLMPVDDAGGPSGSGEGLAVVATTCPECSAVQLYSHAHLERLADRQAH